MTAEGGTEEGGAGESTELYLEAAEVDARRRGRAERYNTVTLPTLRAAGFQLIILLVALHNALALHDPAWSRVAPYAVLCELYVGASWIVLRRLYRRAPELLPIVFLALDVVLFAGAVYVTGANRSWLFPVVFMRVADQTATNFRRAFGWAHFTVACYLVMILFAAAQPGSTVDWALELTKAALLYSMGVYASFTARTAERLRDRLVHTVRVARDLVARLGESSAETQRALELTEVASRSKSEFLANMSHELRTPLNSVIGFADVLLKNRKAHLDDTELGYLQRIRGNGAHLLTIIDDILDLSRIEAGRLPVELSEVDVRLLIDEAIASFAGSARAPDVKLVAEVPGGLSSIHSDRNRLRQVLVNLVGNALKFTPTGSVRVRVIARGATPVAIEVIDTGIGIPPDRLPMIFRPFEQGDNTTRRRYGGTGLGLSISRSLCDLLGCRLEGESEPGRGSTFRVVLPAVGD